MKFGRDAPEVSTIVTGWIMSPTGQEGVMGGAVLQPKQLDL